MHNPSPSCAANSAEFKLLPEKYMGGSGCWSGRGQIAIFGKSKNSSFHANGVVSVRALRTSRVAAWVFGWVSAASTGSYALNSLGVPRSKRTISRPWLSWSSIAISSATRTGLLMETSGPSSAMRARCTIRVKAPANGPVDGTRMSGEE
jgi:hypothetical protein